MRVMRRLTRRATGKCTPAWRACDENTSVAPLLTCGKGADDSFLQARGAPSLFFCQTKMAPSILQFQPGPRTTPQWTVDTGEHNSRSSENTRTDPSEPQSTGQIYSRSSSAPVGFPVESCRTKSAVLLLLCYMARILLMSH